MNRFFIVVSGPTAVGKTEFIDRLIEQLPFDCAIINGDMGQMYTPLSIGTAKPRYKLHKVQHYLFDILDQPVNYTVDQYRNKVIACMETVWQQNKIPIIVGGSGFYLKSLFFAVQHYPIINSFPQEISQASTAEIYVHLQQVDPIRAAELHPHDRYRIMRALEIWYTTGMIPSQVKPLFNPPGTSLLIFLQRDKKELEQRIYARTQCMIKKEGWINEVVDLGEDWKHFLLEKKLIGYPEIINHIRHKTMSTEELITLIAVKTRQYAKRQRIFFDTFKQELINAQKQNKQTIPYKVHVEEANLTLFDHTLYLKNIVMTINRFVENL